MATYITKKNSLTRALNPGSWYVFRVRTFYDGEEYVSGWSDPAQATVSDGGITQGGITQGENIDIGTGKILYSNVYPTLADLPDAASYHGMFAHVHAEEAAYYAHAGNWVRLADDADVPTAFVSGLNGLTGPVILAGGSNVQIGQSGNRLTISSTQTFTTLNGESGTLSLVGSDGISVSTVDGTITVSGAGLATEGFVNQAVADLVDSAPQTLDTLAELANALNNDSDFAANVTTLISQKTDTSLNNLTGSVSLVAGDNINVTTAGQNVVISGEQGGIAWSTPPQSGSSPGSPGDIAYDDNHLYLRTSQAWRQVALSPISTNITISQQPSNQSVADGQDATFTVLATAGGETIAYQWEQSADNGSTFVDVANATSNSLTVTANLSLDGYQYRASLSAPGAADVISEVAALTVSPAITITAQPQDITVVDGGSGSLSVSASVSDGSTPTYQWEESTDSGGTWSSLAGETNAIYTIVDASSASDGMRYRVVVSADGVADVISEVAALTVSPAITITAQPQDITVADGGSGSLSVSASVSDGSTPTYQWERSTDSGLTWISLAGEVSATLSIQNVAESESGSQYRAVISASGANNETSAVATLTVTGPYGILTEDGDRLLAESGEFIKKDLSIFDISTASFVQSASVSSLSTDCAGLFFKDDGSKMFVGGLSLNRIGEYSLSTPWDISTAVLTSTFSVSNEMQGSGSGGGPWGVFIGDSGTRLYVSGDSDPGLSTRFGLIAEYALSSAWDISTASLTQTQSVDAEAKMPSVWFSQSGQKMFVHDSFAPKEVHEYSLGTPWDISTLSLTASLPVSGPGYSFSMTSDGLNMYVDGNQYSMQTPFSISAATLTAQFSLPWPTGTFVKPDGSRLWALSSSQDNVSEYALG